MEYAILIEQAISEIFVEDGESPVHIDVNELAKDDNATAFFHALANVVPNHIYGKFTGKNITYLEFNHQANMMCFEYLNRADE